MKGHILKKLMMLVCFFSFFYSVQAIGQINELESAMRVQILPENLIVTDDGLFLIDSGDVLPLKAVFADQEGLYILIPLEGKRHETMHNQCLNGHPIYHQACGGCANVWCVFRCKCHSPWSSNPS